MLNCCSMLLHVLCIEVTNCGFLGIHIFLVMRVFMDIFFPSHFKNTHTLHRNSTFWRLKLMSIHENNTQKIDLEDIKEILRHIAEMISKPSEYISDKIRSDSNEIKSRNIQVTPITYEEKHTALYNSMDSLATALKNNELFYDEYFDFCEIQDMIKDTLNRDSALITQSDLEFIMGLVEDFSRLLNCKIDLIENNEFNEKEFESGYDSYLETCQ